jgi:cytochrome c oxidase assembly protein subunit 15
MAKHILFFGSLLSIVITWVLISFGAAVRLYGAGLACPDWPLCYGTLTPPATFQILLEVGHRYLASFLGLLIMIAYFLCFHSELKNHRKLAGWLFFLVVFQGVIGGLTVLLKLNFSTVVLHLLLGNLLFFGLIYFFCELYYFSKVNIKVLLQTPPKIYYQTKWLVWLYFFMLLSGGLNSSTYAGYICNAFPLCNSESSFSFFWDSSNNSLLWNFWRGWNFSFRFLEIIHLGHRITVVLGSIVLVYFAIKHFIPSRKTWALCGYLLIALISCELILGVMNALLSVPVFVSIFHTTLASSITGVLAVLQAKSRFSTR